MSTASARAITYSVVALLAVAAFRTTPPIATPAPGTLAVMATMIETPARAPLGWRSAVDTVNRGETLVALLERRGVRGADAAGVMRALASIDGIDARRIPAGLAVTVGGTTADSAPSDVTLHLSGERLVHLQRDGAAWSGATVAVPWTIDTVAIGGTITSTLAAALDIGGTALPRAERAELAWALADIFEYRVDMSRDLQQGDRFRALVERASGPAGTVKLKRVLGATFDVQGGTVAAVRFASRGSSSQFFDGTGRSLRASFLRAPLEFRRVSSVFGKRRHPILGVWRAHQGLDYAAAQGTPVRTIGDGTVIFAGRKGGYGNVLEVRHRNGYVSRYAHLRNFARGVRAGKQVSVGTTVAYVGTTGLSTAPHLHFEMLVGGVHRDPKVALRSLKGGEPLPARDRGEFERTRAQLLASLGD